MLRPTFDDDGDEYDRGAAELLGAVLRALSVGRDTLPCGGRGTERPAALDELLPSEREALLFGDSEIRLLLLPIELGGRGTLRFIAVCVGSERDGVLLAPIPLRAAPALPELMLCGGRGTERPAEPEVAAPGRLCAVSGPRAAVDGLGLLPAAELSGPRAEVCGARVAALELPRATLAGGVIRLTVGRDAAALVGWAAGCPACAPSVLSRVGVTCGPRALLFTRLCALAGVSFAIFEATGSECCSVLLEAAVNPLCVVA